MNNQNLIKVATLVGPSVAIATAGAIECLSDFAIPSIKSTASNLSRPAALAQLRRLFSVGSHTFPLLAFIATTTFGYLAYAEPLKRTGYAIAAIGCIGIYPFTTLVMLPIANGRLIELHENAKKTGDSQEKGRGEVDELLEKFTWLNRIRAGIMAFGGLTGLWVALS